MSPGQTAKSKPGLWVCQESAVAIMFNPWLMATTSIPGLPRAQIDFDSRQERQQQR